MLARGNGTGVIPSTLFLKANEVDSGRLLWPPMLEVGALWQRYCDEHGWGQYRIRDHSDQYLREFLAAALGQSSKRRRTN